MKPLFPLVAMGTLLVLPLGVSGQRGIPLQQARQLAQPVGAEPIDVLNLEKAWAGAEPLLQLAVPVEQTPAIRNAAVRALGRLEDPRLVPQLLALRGNTLAIDARADAIAQSLHGFDPSKDPGLVGAATAWMFDVASPSITGVRAFGEEMPVVEPLSRIKFPTAERVHDVEHILLKMANFAGPDPRLGSQYEIIARAFESLARVNQTVTPLQEDTADRLKKMVRGLGTSDSEGVRLYAFMALNAGRALDADTEQIAVKDAYWEVRRVAAAVLAGGGAGLDEETRLDAIQQLLADRTPQVRYEALRAYVRRSARARGCAPIEALINDPDMHVTLAVFDALGDLCKADGDLTDRIAAEARVPPAVGSWHRETHAFVALAKRDPARALPSMEAFVTHPVWWVRMYAAGAAAVAGDTVHLEKLAYDANDNVREAALGAWRRLRNTESDPAILEALKRGDVQLLRAAATLLKDSPRSTATYGALMAALARLTKEGKETSRDARLKILEALAIHAHPDNANELVPFLKDFDPKIADKAAELLTGFTGKVAQPEPVPYRRGWPQEYKDLKQCVALQLGSLGTVRMQMEPALAPIAVDHFLKLAVKDKYYNGLTFHRVVPNFVLQAGSPGANEYSGAKEYMRDEIAGRNTRGTVGLSTRGRNTADAQFFINLVDNSRLNDDYTIFARLVGPADLAIVDKIQEGDVITSIEITKCVR